MQHTPGPWKVEPPLSALNEYGYEVIRDGVGICELGRTEQDGANARLIAAAPDLLAMCKELLRAGTPSTKNLHDLEAVIAKAESLPA